MASNGQQFEMVYGCHEQQSSCKPCLPARYLKAVASASGAWEGILGTVLKGSPVYLEWALPRADAWKTCPVGNGEAMGRDWQVA